MPAESPPLQPNIVRMLTEHEQHSLEYQDFIIWSYAARNNLVIARSYTDAGKIGWP
jgi:predicted nuclease of predicted toxin-antitoxin system